MGASPIVGRDQKVCGTCKFWGGKRTIKIVRDGVQCSPLTAGCSNLAISRNQSFRATSGSDCSKWQKNENL